eukprot:11224263-Lingulodinium_polyedra.AAC.1
MEAVANKKEKREFWHFLWSVANSSSVSMPSGSAWIVASAFVGRLASWVAPSKGSCFLVFLGLLLASWVLGGLVGRAGT